MRPGGGRRQDAVLRGDAGQNLRHPHARAETLREMIACPNRKRQNRRRLVPDARITPGQALLIFQEFEIRVALQGGEERNLEPFRQSQTGKALDCELVRMHCVRCDGPPVQIGADPVGNSMQAAGRNLPRWRCLPEQ